MKEGAIIHLVLSRSCDLVEPHVPLRSARQKGVIQTTPFIWICNANHRGKPLRRFTATRRR